MRRFMVIFFTFWLGLSLVSVWAQDKSKDTDKKKDTTGTFQPSPPPKQEIDIITRPLQPDTGRYIEHGTDIKDVPYEPPKETPKKTK